MSGTLLWTEIAEFRGAYPDIPLPAGFDREALPADTFFATLPIGKVNARSRNGRTYTESAVQKLVDEVNANQPRGWWGHPEHLERTKTAPALQWVAAILAEDGTAWGKCIPLTQDARELLRVAKAANREVGSSIYGEATMQGDQVVDLELNYIDLVTEPEWVGVPETPAIPVLTSETHENEDDKMSEQLIAELTAQRDAANKRIAELEAANSKLTKEAAEATAKATEAQAKIAEQAPVLTKAQEQLDGIKKVLTSESYISLNIAVSGDNMMDVIEELLEELMALKATQVGQAMDAMVTEMVKVPTVRAVVARELALLNPQPKSNPNAANRVKVSETAQAGFRKQIEEILARDYIKDLLKVGATAAQGGSVVVSEFKRSPEGFDRNKYDEEAGKKFAREIGALNR